MKIAIVKNMILCAEKMITENKEKLDNLNVFPIPDGDTGTNMEKTLLGAIRAMQEIGSRELDTDDLKKIYDSVLMSAQGNSGAILSQWIKGFFIGLEKAECFDAVNLNEAFMEASESSYNAVSQPVEGTFLTVAREAYEFAEENLSDETTVEEYLRFALKGAKDSLSRTPELLPVLKSAGVVDSGGCGLVCIIDGMLCAVSGEKNISIDEFSEKIENDVLELNQEFGYCTEMIVELKENCEFSMAVLTTYLNEIGNSVVAVKNDNKIKIHVHTLEPEKVLAYCHNYGEFIKIKIDNMTVQHTENFVKQKAKCVIIAVADGDGTEELFRSMGADIIIRGGQTENVAIGTIIESFEKKACDDIIFLTNNENIFLVAEQAKTIFTKARVYIIPTSSMAEGYSALSMIDKNKKAEDIVKEMNDAIQGIVTGAIAKATKNTVCDGIAVQSGQYIGMKNGSVVSSDENIISAAKEMLSSVEDISEKESFVILCSNMDNESILEKIKEEIYAVSKNAEVYFVNGGQKVYDFVFAIE